MTLKDAPYDKLRSSVSHCHCQGDPQQCQDQWETVTEAGACVTQVTPTVTHCLAAVAVPANTDCVLLKQDINA